MRFVRGGINSLVASRVHRQSGGRTSECRPEDALVDEDWRQERRVIPSLTPPARIWQLSPDCFDWPSAFSAPGCLSSSSLLARRRALVCARCGLPLVTAAQCLRAGARSLWQQPSNSSSQRRSLPRASRSLPRRIWSPSGNIFPATGRARTIEKHEKLICVHRHRYLYRHPRSP